MKRIPIFFLLFIFLASCGSPAPVATATPQPTATFTPLPTLTPTITPTSTNTPDPDRPSDAVGDRDPVTGYYTKTAEDGITILYWIVNSETPTLTSWYKNGIENPMSNGGAYFIDDPENNFAPLISLQVFYKEGIDAPSIRHNTKPAPDGGPSFSKEMLQNLYNRDNGKAIGANQFIIDLYDGKISFPVTDVDGNTFELKINSDTKVNVFLVETGDFIPDFEVSYLQSVTTYDSKGSISIIVASTKSIDAISDTEFVELLLFSFFRIIVSQDQSYTGFFSKPKNGMSLGMLAEWATKGPTPYFQIIR